MHYLLSGIKLSKRNGSIDKLSTDTTALSGDEVTDILVEIKICKILPVHPTNEALLEDEPFNDLFHKH